VIRRVAILALAAQMLLGPGSSAAAGNGARSGTVPVSIAVAPVAIALGLSPSGAPTGVPVHARATVTNLGSLTLVTIELTLRTPSGVTIVGAATQELRNLRAGRSTSTTWKLCQSTAGNHVLMVDALAIDTAGRSWVAVSNAVVLIVTPGTKAC
jgi:hypothetical protein